MTITSSVTDYHIQTTAAWEAMIAECEAAKSSIYIEEYILDPDSIGNRFIEVLIRRAKEGLDVRLLLDWWGCKSLRKSDAPQALKDAGVQLCYFNAPGWNWLGRLEIFPRDHRKILMVDGRSAFVGGVCIYEKIHDWRDSMLRVEGAILAQLEFIFEQSWEKANSMVAHQVKAHPDFETDDKLSIYANAPDSGEHQFIEKLLAKIESATQSIQMTTPYFTPDKRLRKALLAAAARGVTVEILLSDYSKYAPYVVGKYCAGQLVKGGVKVYYYQPSMLHLKMMVIDENWAAIGSCNLDGLSLHHNHEVMLVATDEAVVKTLTAHFAEDKHCSRAFRLDDWRRRPLIERICGYGFYPLQSYL